MFHCKEAKHNLNLKFGYKQESPPAWTQEAYHPPCSEYSFCCPNWVLPPLLTWPGGVPYLGTPQQGTPSQGTPPARVPPSRVPLLPGYRVPPAGPGRVPPQLPRGILGNVAKHYGIWVPPWLPRGILGNVAKHYGIWVPTHPWWTDRIMDGQTRVKTLPSRHTTYAGGN